MKGTIEQILPLWGIENAQLSQIYPTAWEVNHSHVIKVYDDKKQMERNIRISEILSDCNIPVAKTVLTKEREKYVVYQNRYFVMSEKLQGSNVSDPKDKTIAWKMGAAIARLHTAFIQCEREVDFWDNSLLKEMKGWIRENLEEGEWETVSKEEYARAVDLLESVYPYLPKQLIHRDVHFGNFLFFEGSLSGYIDFDLSQRNIRIFDLCYFLTGLLAEETDDAFTKAEWMENVKAVIAGYESMIPLSEKEKIAIPWVMECIEILFVAYFMGMKERKHANDACQVFHFIQSCEDDIANSLKSIPQKKGTEQQMKDFVRVKGKEFYFKGKPILFSGLGVGSWLNMEHFMMGLPGTDQQIRQTFARVLGKKDAEAFFDSFIMNFMGEEDFAFLRDAGVNLLRVPFNYRLFIDDEHPDEYREEGFRYLDRLLAFCRKYEIFLLPDLHTAPGGQNPDWHSDNQTGIPQFWHYGIFQEQIIGLWKRIAARYRDETYLLGYDLLNEPFLMPKREGMLNAFYEKVTRAVRQEDQNHILFIEGDFFSMDFSSIMLPKDEQSALTFHFYPGVWEKHLTQKAFDAGKRVERMDELLTGFDALRQEFGRPVLCGEAGVDLDREDIPFSMQLVEENLALFHKHGISWTLWSYKDAQWMGLAWPRSDTGWMELVKKVRTKWSHYGQMQLADELMDEIGKRYTEDFSKDLKYELQFQLRGLLYRMEQEYLLKPVLMEYEREELMALTVSFRFENCGFYEEYRDLLRKYSWRV